MDDLDRIVDGLGEAPREAKPITDIPLGPRAPRAARNVEIASRPQVREPWRKRAKPVPELIEPIPAPEIEVAQPKAKLTQQDYYRMVRNATRRKVGRELSSEAELDAIVGNLKRKDK